MVFAKKPRPDKLKILVLKPAQLPGAMIIYGTQNKSLSTRPLFDKCPSCGTQNSLSIHLFQKYAHIFWIPLFPIGKTGVSHCTACNQATALKDMPPSLRASYDDFKALSKTPLWVFSGLGIIAIGIAAILLLDKNKSDLNARLILAPQTGDVFEVKTPENQYTLYKIKQVDGDSVVCQMLNYETDGAGGLPALKRKGDQAWADAFLAFSKGDLKQMLEQHEILNIDRR